MNSAGSVFSQGFTVAGHKIPYAAVGVVVAIIGVLVVLRARSQGGAVVQAGAPAVSDPAASGAAAAFQPYASIGDLSTGLADLRNAITSGQLQAPAPLANSAAPGAAVGTVTPPQFVGSTPQTLLGLVNSDSWSGLQSRLGYPSAAYLFTWYHPGVAPPPTFAPAAAAK